MYSLYMTAQNSGLTGGIARIFGVVVDYIYRFFEGFFGEGNVNIAFTIIVFTVVVYVLMLPLTYSQQKFSSLQRKIQPELKEIQKKYAGKKDQASMLKQQEETQALYDKYGISMSGSCVQLLIQMPILFGLFRVFNNLPAYIGSVRGIFDNLVAGIQGIEGYENLMQNVATEVGSNRIRVDFLADGLNATQLGNYIVDVVYLLNDKGWAFLSETFPSLTDVISQTQGSLEKINYLFALNISDTPLNIIGNGWAVKDFPLILGALLIPALSYLSNMVTLRLATGNQKQNLRDADAATQQMQMMNRVMPLVSLFFVFSVPVGLGLYWITGAIFRSGCQFFLNKHFDKMDVSQIIEKNKEKAKEKKEKRDKQYANIAASATVNTRRTMTEKAKVNNETSDEVERFEAATEARAKARPGSMTSKANLVEEYNRKNNRK